MSGVLSRAAPFVREKAAAASASVRKLAQVVHGGRALSTANTATAWVHKDVEYRRVPTDYDTNAIFEFNKKYGTSPLNFIPDEPVRAHLSKLETEDTIVWGAFYQDEMVGFISGEVGSDYWEETGPGSKKTCFIHEFVVKPDLRGKQIGQNLTSLSVDPALGIFGCRDDVEEMYTTVHVENVPSRTAFIRGGYTEVVTYKDYQRDRATTVLKCTREMKTNNLPPAKAMRVIGIQSGNAVDGIDVGIFDFEPVQRDGTDPRKVGSQLKYTTLANKTFTFSPEQRNLVLGLRSLALEDGNDYARGNYIMGEWMADNALALMKEANIDPDTVHLIGSHGQTVSGHPHWEFGDLSVIAQRTGITTCGDFRPADVAAGGNGTPCTCTYDSLMLRPEPGSKWRIAINIGGTSSVTFCPPLGTDPSVVPHGLDPGIGVFFMDLCTAVIDPSLEYDDEGKLARSGTTNEELLAQLLKNKYYDQDTLPIGVGPDDFPETLFKEWHALAKEMGVSDIDFLSTLVDHSTKQTAIACAKFGGPNIVNGNFGDVILRGGVTHNKYWVERLQFHIAEQCNGEVEKILILDDIGLSEESWENAMYAMFGYLSFNNLYNFVPSCTGANRHVVGGRMAPGNNFAGISLLNETQ
jgi:anhydro-N-acetylmuramic acid kinase